MEKEFAICKKVGEGGSVANTIPKRVDDSLSSPLTSDWIVNYTVDRVNCVVN